MPPFPAIGQENAILAALASQRQAIAQSQARATPALAANASSIYGLYPWMHPSVTYALAAQGYNSQHPVVRAAADASMAQNLSDRGSLQLGQVADPNAAGQVTTRAAKIRDRLLKYADSPFGDDKVKMQQQLVKFLKGAGEHELLTQGKHLADRLDDVTQTYGTSSGLDIGGALGDVYKAATSWLPGNDPNLRKNVPGLQELHQGLGTAASYAGAALNTGGQAVAGSLRVGAGKPLFEPWTPQDVAHVGEQTSGGQLLKQLVEGGPGNISVPRADVAASAAAVKYSPYLINGHAWTPGRAAAQTAGLDPDSLAFKIGSGLGDAAVSWYTDPAAIALRAVGDTRRAKQVFAEARSTGGPLRGTEEYYAAHPEINAARERVGVVNGAQKVVVSPYYKAWKVGDEGGNLIMRLTDSHDAFTIHQNLAQNGLDIPLQDASGNSVFQVLANTRTDQETVAYLDHLVQDTGDITKIPHWAGVGSGSEYVQPRWTGIVPGKDLDFTNPGDTWRTINNQLINGKATNNQRQAVFNTYVRDLDTRSNREATLQLAANTLEANMVAHGTDAPAARGFARIYKQNYNNDRLYFIDQHGNNVDVPAFVNGGEPSAIPHPASYSEMQGDKVTLQWDYRAIRKATANPVVKMLIDNKAAKEATDLLDAANQVWRDTHIFRPAIIFRTTGAAQLEIASVGASSLANHPLKAMAVIIGNHPEGWLSKRLSNVGEMMANHGLDNVPGVDRFIAGLKGSYTTTPGGVPLSSIQEAMDAFGHSFSSFRKGDGGTKLMLDQWAAVDRDHPEYSRGWMTELAQLAADPVNSKLPKFASLDEAHQWFMTGGGKGLRMRIAQNPQYEVIATDENAARRYLEKQYERIEIKTQHDPRLVDAVTTGRINDHPIVDWVQTAEDQGRSAKSAMAQLDAIKAEGIGPDMVKVPKMYAVNTSARQRIVNRMSQAEDFFYKHLLVDPNATAAAHPFVMQQSWKHMENEVFAHMTPEARTEMLRRFDSANLPANVETKFRQMDAAIARSEANAPPAERGVVAAEAAPKPEAQIKTVAEGFDTREAAQHHIDTQMARRPTPKIVEADGKFSVQIKETPFQMPERTPLTFKGAGEKLSLEQADYLAVRRALVDYKQVLHQLYDKSQIFDALRFLFPFGDAWRQMAQRWIKITATQPQVIRRAQQIYDAASNSGVVHTNPQTGESVITYPGSELLTDKVLGAKIPLEFAGRDLNLLGEGTPGVGPTISVGLPYVAKGLQELGGPDLDKPEFDWLKKLIYPKGGEPTGEPIGDIARTLAPAWGQKVYQALWGNPDSMRDFGNVMFYMARYLASTGEYDLRGDNAADETRRLWSDARDKAHYFRAVQGVAQAILPASPSPAWMVDDKDGSHVLMMKLIQDYHKHEVKDGYAKAFDWLIKTHGADNFLLAQSASKTNIPNLPATQRAIDWEKNNSGLVDKYPSVWTFFSPLGGSFSQSAYSSQFPSNQRSPYTMEDRSKLANARLAASEYQHAAERYPVESRTPQQRVWLKKVDDYLVGHYPGYAGVNHRVEQFPLPPLIEELTRASRDPKLNRTDTGKAIKQYLAFRQQVIEDAQANGHPSPWGIKAQEANVAWLEHKGLQLSKQYPGFAPVFDWVFSRETGGFTKGTTGG